MDNNSSGVETSRDKNFVPCLRFMTAATFNTNILILLVYWAGWLGLGKNSKRLFIT